MTLVFLHCMALYLLYFTCSKMTIWIINHDPKLTNKGQKKACLKYDFKTNLIQILSCVTCVLAKKFQWGGVTCAESCVCEGE